MKLDILEMKELENGDAELIIEMDDETKRYLVNYAFIDIIKRGLAETERLYDE